MNCLLTTTVVLDKVILELAKDFIARGGDVRLLDEKIRESIELGSDLLVDDLQQNGIQRLDKQRQMRYAFEQRLYQTWKYAFDFFEVIVRFAQEVGSSFNSEHRAEAVQNNDFVFEVLIRLHARSCRIAEEIFVLMKSGYATAALARWRTMHELSVVGYVIAENGYEAANRYLLHEIVQSADAAEEYQVHHATLGYAPMKPAELTKLLAERDRLIVQFGKPFATTYGWAAPFVGHHNPNLYHLEKAIKMTHMRPYYRLASYGIHPNTKGITYSIDNPLHNLLLVGASDAGMADPGQAALISLGQITLTLLGTKVDPDTMLHMITMQKLVDKGKELFIQAHYDLAVRDIRIRGGRAHRKVTKRRRAKRWSKTKNSRMA